MSKYARYLYFYRKNVVLKKCTHIFSIDSSKFRFGKSYKKQESFRRAVILIKLRVIGGLRDPPNYSIYCPIMIRF